MPAGILLLTLSPQHWQPFSGGEKLTPCGRGNGPRTASYWLVTRKGAWLLPPRSPHPPGLAAALLLAEAKGVA